MTKTNKQTGLNNSELLDMIKSSHKNLIWNTHPSVAIACRNKVALSLNQLLLNQAKKFEKQIEKYQHSLKNANKN